jgi:hypothetical protein
VAQQCARRGAGIPLGHARGADRTLRRAKVIDAPDTIFILLDEDNQRFRWGGTGTRRIDRDACGNAPVAQSLDL